VRIIAAFEKTNEISYTSHLDVQRTLQRTFRRAALPLAFSNGFNPHPKLSFATALATGYTSAGEWFEVELAETVGLSEFIARVNAALPTGMRIVEAFEADETIDTLSKLTRAAKYELTVRFDASVSPDDVTEAVRSIMGQNPVIVEKKTKSGVKPADIRPDILEASVKDCSDRIAIIDVVGTLTAAGGLRAETFVRALFDRLHLNGYFTAHRISLYFEGAERLPRLA
jgi:radical SAM-linked protein